MVAGRGFAFGELGSVVYAGKVFEFGFEWGFWVWLEREAFKGIFPTPPALTFHICDDIYPSQLFF